MTKWREVSAYSGQPVEEDAPTNFAGAGSGVDMNPTGMKKKKKKLIDARSKSYKTHRAKLEAARLKREAKKSKFSEKVKESVSEFNVESLLAEDNVDVLKSIVKSKSMKPIKLKDGTMKVDLYTASAIVQVLDKINPANKAKLTKMLNGKKSDFMRASEGIMKMIGKKR
jgi:hypothetical protein|tara:strand:- start:176 stop:682 length:507 start_codon:yes stop_codon:yes gene_type:complete